MLTRVVPTLPLCKPCVKVINFLRVSAVQPVLFFCRYYTRSYLLSYFFPPYEELLQKMLMPLVLPLVASITVL